MELRVDELGDPRLFITSSVSSIPVFSCSPWRGFLRRAFQTEDLKRFRLLLPRSSFVHLPLVHLSAVIHIQAIPFIWRDSSQVFAQVCPSTKTSNFEREVQSKPRIPDKVFLTLSEAACLSKAFRADVRMMKLLASSFL